MEINDLIDNYIVELKRGTLTLGVLSQLQKPQYGYSLLQELEKKNAPIEAGTLYPLLRRLEKQGVLFSEWDTQESRPRKYYSLSSIGIQVYQRLQQEWQQVVNQMNQLLVEEGQYGDD